MKKAVLSEREKGVLRSFIKRWQDAGKTVVVFHDLDEIVVALKAVNDGVERNVVTLWGVLQKMAGADAFVFGAGKNLTEDEKDFLRTLALSRSQEGRPFVLDEVRALAVEMAKATGQKKRVPAVVWWYLKRIAPDLTKKGRKKPGVQPSAHRPAPAKVAIKQDLAAARKILEDIRIVAKAMGKPDGYLAPLEALLTGGVDQKELVAGLEKKVECQKAKLEKQEREIATLANQLRAIKPMARLACRFRTDLGKELEEAKKRYGVDICAITLDDE